MTQLKDSSKDKLQNVPSISPSKSSSLPPDDRHSPFCVSANNEGPERVLLEAPQTPKKSPKKASKGIVLPVPAETTTVRTPTKEQVTEFRVSLLQVFCISYHRGCRKGIEKTLPSILHALEGHLFKGMPAI